MDATKKRLVKLDHMADISWVCQEAVDLVVLGGGVLDNDTHGQIYRLGCLVEAHTKGARSSHLCWLMCS